MTDGLHPESGAITETAIADFWRDGFVVLRAVLDTPTLVRLADAVVRVGRADSTTDMSAMAADLAGNAPDGGARSEADTEPSGAFLAGIDHWREDPDLAWFARESVLPGVVSSIMRTEAVWLYEDSVLVKEAGTADPTLWHQDAGYFQVGGEQICTTWCPLDEVDAASGALSYAVGSHLSGEMYRPNLFVSPEPLPGTEGSVVPTEPDGPIVTIELAPGDVAIHHARTLHAAGGNHTASARRAVSVRYCGDDVRYRLRPGTPRKPHHTSIADGDLLGGPDCPRVWPTE